MDKDNLMMYAGESRKIDNSVWLKLVRGRLYEVEVLETKSGKVRIRIRDGYDTGRLSYSSKEEFDAEWMPWSSKEGRKEKK